MSMDPSPAKQRKPPAYLVQSPSPCAGCKFLRRKCTADCPFARYFPPDQPEKFANVHTVYGACNVAKILQNLNPMQGELAVRSLCYEAEARIKDPIYGCVRDIIKLKKMFDDLQRDYLIAKDELNRYIDMINIDPDNFGLGTDPTVTRMPEDQLLLQQMQLLQEKQILDAMNAANATMEGQDSLRRRQEQTTGGMNWASGVARDQGLFQSEYGDHYQQNQRIQGNSSAMRYHQHLHPQEQMIKLMQENEMVRVLQEQQQMIGGMQVVHAPENEENTFSNDHHQKQQQMMDSSNL